MDLPEFIEEVSGKPLTDLQQSLLKDLRRSYSGKSRIGVILGTHRMPSLPELYWPTIIGDKIQTQMHIIKGRQPDVVIVDDHVPMINLDFAKLEEHLIGLGTCMWDTTGRIYEPEEYLKQPAADHPSKKREPKGPRKRWGKL